MIIKKRLLMSLVKKNQVLKITIKKIRRKMTIMALTMVTMSGIWTTKIYNWMMVKKM